MSPDGTDNVTVAVEDLTTGQTYQFRPGVVENTASTLKVDILATLLVEAQAAGRPLTPEEQSLAVPMIEESLDSAADTLWTQLGPTAVGAFEREAGMTSTVPATDGVWGTTTTTALDRLAMIRTLVEPNSLLTNASRAYVLDLMENITPSQDWGATGGVPPGVTVALKNGFAVIDGWQINTTGWVDGADRDYLIAVLTNGNSSEQYGIDTVNAVSCARLELARALTLRPRTWGTRVLAVTRIRNSGFTQWRERKSDRDWRVQCRPTSRSFRAHTEPSPRETYRRCWR